MEKIRLSEAKLMAAIKQSNLEKFFLWTIIILSIISFITSLYLTYNHYATPTEGSLCDFGESISCSLVNTSIFSEILFIPVAILGALWSFILFGLALKGLKGDTAIYGGLLFWSILGIFSVIYLVIAEIILKSICPFCTLVHIIVIITLIISIILYRLLKKKPTREQMIKSSGGWIFSSIVLFVLIFLAFNIEFSSRENYDDLAKCMTENGVKMYSSFRCGVCAKTRAMFGESFKYIEEIECHPEGKNSETELCIQKEVKGTPTWVREINGIETNRYTGFLDIKELREFSGCEENVA